MMVSIRQLISNLYRRILFEKRSFFLNIKLAFQNYKIVHPDTLLWIDPDHIVYHTNLMVGGRTDFKNRVFDMVKDKGGVYDGDWDISNHKFTDLDFYKALERRMIYGGRWEDTDFYKRELAEIENGKRIWGCKNRQDWDKRCEYIDSLIQSIKKYGYHSDFKLTHSFGPHGIFLCEEMLDQITVNIGRNGDYLFQDGRHRLGIVKLLGIKPIPIKVLVRHKIWVECGGSKKL